MNKKLMDMVFVVSYPPVEKETINPIRIKKNINESRK